MCPEAKFQPLPECRPLLLRCLLLSLEADSAEGFRLAGRYAARVLKGENPGDLPVQQSVKYELIVNLKTARSLGLTVPPTLLALADEVIE
jgi:putative tryptophan/tyrosine transport system substrate-binding protein